MESLRQEDSEATRAEGPARPPPRTTRIRVLHVDDDPVYLRLVAEHLQSQDERFVVATEANAADALQRLGEDRFDCIVSDYQMPRMDGLTFLEAVREDRPEIPFILLTGKGSEEIASEAISRGVTDYLQKGPGTDQYRMLANRVDNAVSRRHAEKRAVSILEAAPDSIVIVGSDGRIRRINRQAEDLFGYDEEELIGEPIEVLIPERYREAHVGHRREYTADPRTRPMGADIDLYALTRDGEEVPVDISLSPMEVGEETEIVAAIRDISERKWREQELREQRVLTEGILEAVPEIIYSLDADGNPVEWNSELSRVTGYSPAELEEIETLGIVPESERDKLLQTLEEILKTGQPATVESYLETKGGEWIPYEFSGDVILGEDGDIRGVTGVGRDISDRKERDRALRETTATLQAIVEATPEAIIVVDEDGVVTRWTPAAERLFGWTADEVVGEPNPIVPEDQREEFEAIVERVWEGDELHGYETVRRAKDGSRIEVSLSTAVVRDADGDPIGAMGILQDISERMARERRYDAIFNQTYQFTGLLDPDGTLVEANQAALDFGGIERDDVVGRKMWDTYWFQLSDETRRVARDAVARARQGEFVRTELEVQGDDRTAIIDFSVKPVTDETGEIVQLVPEGRDITELKRQQETLERQNERLEEFASVVSHDLRNPLTVILGNLEMLQDEVDGRLDEVLQAGERMEKLIDDLLRLASEGRVVDELEPIRLGEIVERAWAMVDAGGARLETVDVEIAADPDRFQELLENLFRNAVDHGGDVTIRVGPLHDGRGFFVEDDGPGIPADERDRVFEPGYSTDDRGTGFGLSIVERIAEAHDWSVHVTESAAGGARFEIRVDGGQVP